MKNLIKLTLLAGALATGATLMNAADVAAPMSNAAAPAGSAQTFHRRALHGRMSLRRRILRQLKLTDGQIAQLKAIHRSTHEAVAGIRGNPALSAEQKRAQIHALRAGARTQMHALLTPEQKAKLARIHARLERRMGGW